MQEFHGAGGMAVGANETVKQLASFKTASGEDEGPVIIERFLKSARLRRLRARVSAADTTDIPTFSLADEEQFGRQLAPLTLETRCHIWSGRDGHR